MKKIKILNLLLISMLVFSLFTTVAVAQDDTLDKIVKSGKIRVGFCVDVPPIKFRDKNNEVAGICADFSKALARDLGVELEYVFSDWAGLIPSLLSQRCDVVIGDMAATLERAKKVNFTIPWRYGGPFIAVRNESEWKSWREMNKEGVEIGCILGTTGESNIKKMIPKATPVIFNSNVEQRLALEQGRIEGISNEYVLVARDVSKSNGSFRLLTEPLQAVPVSFTLRSDDYHFLIWMDLWVERLKSSGELDDLMNYWINTDEWEKDYPGY